MNQMKKEQMGFRPVRKMKQALDEEPCVSLLEKNGTGTLALIGDGGFPYAVPVNYMYRGGCIYFHGTENGHKGDAIAKDARVSMCVIARDILLPEKYTTDFCSVIVFGEAASIADAAKKRRIIRAFAEKFCSGCLDGVEEEIDREWEILTVWELKIRHMSGKQGGEA